MPEAAARLWGILISVLCHGLILLIPISLAAKAPQTFPPVEFVMTMAEEPTPSEPPPPVKEKPRPKPKRKIKPRPRPRPVVTEPVKTDTSIPQPPLPPPAPRRVAVRTGPHVAAFGSATGPAFLRRVMPVYPELARRRGQEGRVVLRLTIDARGSLLKVEVLQAPGFGFEEAAVQAVKRSRFRPATVNGKPVACIARLPIRFVLR